MCFLFWPSVNGHRQTTKIRLSTTANGHVTAKTHLPAQDYQYFRIQPLVLSHLHRRRIVFVGEICIVTKTILKKFFKE